MKFRIRLKYLLGSLYLSFELRLLRISALAIERAIQCLVAKQAKTLRVAFATHHTRTASLAESAYPKRVEGNAIEESKWGWVIKSCGLKICNKHPLL